METDYLNCVEEPKILYPKKKSVSKYVSLLSDCGFKYVFGKIANKEIIIAFLNEVIPDRINPLSGLRKLKQAKYFPTSTHLYSLNLRSSTRHWKR